MGLQRVGHDWATNKQNTFIVLMSHINYQRTCNSTIKDISFFHIGKVFLPALFICCLVTKSRLTLGNPRNCSPPGSSVHGIYWSGLPFPSPGDLPDPGIELRYTALQADSLPSEPPGKPYSLMTPQPPYLSVSLQHDHYFKGLYLKSWTGRGLW